MTDLKVGPKTIVILVILLGVASANIACMPFGRVDDSFTRLPNIDEDVRKVAVVTLKEAKARRLDLKNSNNIFNTKVQAAMQFKGIPSKYKLRTSMRKFSKSSFVFEYKIEHRGGAVGMMFVTNANGSDADLKPGEEPKSELFD